MKLEDIKKIEGHEERFKAYLEAGNVFEALNDRSWRVKLKAYMYIRFNRR